MNTVSTHAFEANVAFRDRQRNETNERLSICHVIGGGDWAGAEAQSATLLKALSKSPAVAPHAIVLREGRLARELRHFGLDVCVAEQQGRRFPQVVLECSRFVRSRRVQILHSHGYKESIISLLLARACKVPYLVRTEHGHPEPYSVIRGLKHWCVLALDRAAARYTPDRIVSVSKDLGQYWKEHANPEKVIVVPNGVDLDRVQSAFTSAEAKQRLGITPNSLVVGMVARLDKVKRPDLFIATARFLAERLTNVRFVIAGSGSQEESLRALVSDLGLQDRVLLLGQRSDVYDVLKAMDVLLICSDHEGIPMAMLEAMALGVTVISRNVGGISEVIRDGVTGILVPSGTPETLGLACYSVLKNASLRASLAEAARQEIDEKHSADKNAKTMLEMYESVNSSHFTKRITG
jgi:L-malate glycosyltransferase